MIGITLRIDFIARWKDLFEKLKFAIMKLFF